MPENNDSEVRWTVIECDEEMVRSLVAETGVSPVIARILVNRGITTSEELRKFLDPSLDHLHDPSLLPDLDIGVERVARAIENNEKICVHGDYDVDGVTSAALLVRVLSALKADVIYRLPHRQREGYDIKPASVDECAAEGVKVIITCDCGICAHDTAERAKELGIDLIITDHHEPGSVLPLALAVINPKRRDANYPFPEIAGVGVAFKFAQGLVRRLGHSENSFISKFLDLAALGTVGDVVPLLDENRAIVKYGLEALASSKKLGLQTMLRFTNLRNKPLSAYYLGFVLGPRINAVGRLDDASIALRLLLTRDDAEAAALMEEMERCNNERRAEQDRILAEAIEQVKSKDLSRTRVLVLSHTGWNTGVIGIVAGKIAECYGRPAILIGRDEECGMGYGSARSTPAFNIHEGLIHCHELLVRYGGHALAAGLSLSLDNLAAFEGRINALALDIIKDEDLVPQVIVDAELDASDINRELADAIESMEPFGMANQEPLFMTRGMTVKQMQRVGDGSHLRMQLEKNGSAPIQCIAFGFGHYAEMVQLGESVDLCYSIRLNKFNGSETVQLSVKAIRAPKQAVDV